MTISRILTITKESKAVYKEKNSEFIAFAFPIASIEDFSSILNKLKKEFYDATHHCYALKLKDNTFKYSDDGEPNGTAGIRIYNAIEHFNLADVLVVVVRYYGGTNLGVGPLGKAYYIAAENAISASEIISKNPFYKVYIQTDITHISALFNLLSKLNAAIIEQNYLEGVGLTLHLPYEKIEEFKKDITAITRDKYKLVIEEEVVYL